MLIRRAQLSDAEQIAALVESCYRGDSSRRGWTTEADLVDGTRTDVNEVASLITSSGSMILMCMDEDDLVGSVNIQQQGDACYLGMLSVKPGVQGSGIGKRLIEAAELEARNTWNSKRMTLGVISVRSELIAYYERRGYRRTGETRPFVSDEVHGTARIEGMQFEMLEKLLEVWDSSPIRSVARPGGAELESR